MVILKVIRFSFSLINNTSELFFVMILFLFAQEVTTNKMCQQLSVKDLQSGFQCGRCSLQHDQYSKYCMNCKGRTMKADCPICGKQITVENIASHPCKVLNRLIVVDREIDLTKEFNIMLEQQGIATELPLDNKTIDTVNDLMEVIHRLGITLDDITSSNTYKESHRIEYCHIYKKGYNSGISMAVGKVKNRMVSNQNLMEGLNISGNQIKIVNRIMTEETNKEVISRRKTGNVKIHKVQSSLKSQQDTVFKKIINFYYNTKSLSSVDVAVNDHQYYTNIPSEQKHEILEEIREDGLRKFNGNWTKIGLQIFEQLGINDIKSGSISRNIKRILLENDISVNVATRYRRKKVKIGSQTLNFSMNVKEIRDENLLLVATPKPVIVDDQDDVLGVQLDIIESFEKVLLYLLKHNCFSKYCLQSAKFQGADLQASYWGDATGNIGSKDSLFCTSYGLINNLNKCFKPEKARLVNRRYLGFMGYFKENTKHFDTAIKLLGESIYQVGTHEFKVHYKQEYYTFRIRVTKLKGDAPFIQKVLGNSQGGNEACFLCDQHKSEWLVKFFNTGKSKTILSMCTEYNEKHTPKVPKLLVSFLDKLDDQLVKDIFSNIEVVIDSLHLVKNLFENVRESVMNYLQTYLNESLRTEFIELHFDIIKKESIEIGGDLTKLKKVRYYRKVLSNVDEVYLKTISSVQDTILNSSTISQSHKNEAKVFLDIIKQIFCFLAEMTYYLYKSNITNPEIVRYGFVTFQLFHLLEKIPTYSMKLYDHITYNHSFDFVKTQTQSENSNEQDECIFKFVRIVMHLFGGRQYFKEKYSTIIESDIIDQAKSGMKSKQWERVPKLFELIWRRLEAKKELSEKFGNTSHANNHNTFKQWSSHNYSEISIPKSMMENYTENKKWDNFVDKIYPYIVLCVNHQLIENDKKIQLLEINHVGDSTVINSISECKKCATLINRQFAFFSQISQTNAISPHHTNSTPPPNIKETIFQLQGRQLDEIILFFNLKTPTKPNIEKKRTLIMEFLNSNTENFSKIWREREDIFLIKKRKSKTSKQIAKTVSKRRKATSSSSQNTQLSHDSRTNLSQTQEMTSYLLNSINEPNPYFSNSQSQDCSMNAMAYQQLTPIIIPPPSNQHSLPLFNSQPQISQPPILNTTTPKDILNFNN